MQFTIGSDPEFILNDDRNICKSAIGIIKGTRENRLKINENEFYYDNVLAECTIKPSSSKEEFYENINESIENLKNIVSPYNLSNLSFAYFSKEELNHPDAKKSGCESEYCAYSLEKISSERINSLFKISQLRTAGGHVHLGTELGKDHESCVMLVRMLDLFLGFPFLFLDPSVERRKLFGSPGRYRQPEYGIEYRTLGNYWLFEKKLIELVYDICEFVISFTKEKGYENFWQVDYEKLNSDEFWNNDGDPSNCHNCHGYDVNNFKKLFTLNKKELIINSKEIIKIINYYLPKHIKNKITF